MSYQGKVIHPNLKRELKGTNTFTFQMVDSFFDSLVGDYVRNEFIDELFAEQKIKLLYDGNWYEFFIKKVNERKVLNSIVKDFTCTDAFIDELSRNGYGITFDEELNNNVEQAGVFTEEVLDESVWKYHPEFNWGDFSEFQEEKLFKIPVSQFGSKISGYKLWFELTNKQKEKLNIKEISNVYTKDCREVEISDDAARTMFWDQQNFDNPNEQIENPLALRFIENIPNDGYIYIPYSCLNFCYGSKDSPDQILKYDRAATETALTINNKLVLAPDSVDPRTIIQFLAVPAGQKIEIDEAGVVLNRDYYYFMTLKQWNEMIQNNTWYFFEDTRLVDAETLGAEDLMNAEISHTFRYLFDAGPEKIIDTYRESWGNKVVFYDGYLSDVDQGVVKGRKYSITNRTEINISDEINQYTTVYNNSPDQYKNNNENLYSEEDWTYQVGDNKYRVCSKLETRQIVPQLARNLVQNGTEIKSLDGWSSMKYLEVSDNQVYSSSLTLKTLQPEDITEGTVLYYGPPRKSWGYEWRIKDENQVDDLHPLTLYNKGQEFWKREGNINNFIFWASITEEVSGHPKYSQIRNLYSQVFNNNQPSVLYLYADNNNRISWSETKNNQKKDYTTQLSSEDYQVVNFGIIGQEKKIEKDKIYCLGISAIAQKDFQIYIGKGSLINEGNYSLSGKYLLIDSSMIFVDNPAAINPSSFNWKEFNSEETILKISPTIFPVRYLLFRAPETIENPYFIIQSKQQMLLNKVEFFEAYTKGYDSFKAEEAPYYRYSGRDLFGIEQPESHKEIPWNKTEGGGEELSFFYSYCFKEEEIRNRILFEDTIMLGSTYGYQKYYIQRLKTLPPAESNEATQYYDTCGVKAFISSKNLKEGQLPLDEAKYTEDNYVIETNYINLNKCQYYIPNTPANTCDCSYGGTATKTCYYQKFGYCPYRFETEKHNRRIRTLKISKSNKFNILQEISKVFEFYPQFHIEHKANGKVVKDNNGFYQKQFFYITEKGTENKIGFRYEKNLKDISREIVSDQIVSKLYVEDVDSEISKTGLCSIKNAEDNPSKDSFIIDFSYYIAKGMLDEDEVMQDLYGIYPTSKVITNSDEMPQGFLRQLGYYNSQYDEISNKIINLQSSSYNELEANLTVNLTGITTAQEQLLKIKQQMERFKAATAQITDNQSYENYKTKYSEQEAILIQMISDTFFTNGTAANNETGLYNLEGLTPPESYTDIIKWFDCIEDYDKMKENWVDNHLYTCGILGQFNKEYNQIQAWKKERASYLKLINRISAAFYKKYEPYLKEGTWTDSNYLTDNAYYFGALDVAAEGAIPKVSYSISVLDLGVYDEYKDVYGMDLADITYVEDTSIFGVNKKTGFPNRLKVLVSEISTDLDDISKVNITVQNYTTQFEDLFQQVSASVQSLTYNENIYKRSSNFTSLQNIKTDSLQGTLNQNNLTLLNTSEQNIQLDNSGTKGSDINNHSNKYKLDGQGLFFSNDGGQHWSVGVGPSGINADYIKVGTLDATKVRIVDGNYLYFSWDKQGIAAYRDPQGASTSSSNLNDYALYNKFGLSIVDNGQIKLRAGYNFNGNDGLMKSEKEPGSEIGFYLYNAAGKEIFSTSAATSNDKNRDTARLKLIGEMFVSDTIGSTDIDEKIYSYIYKKQVVLNESFSGYTADNFGQYTIPEGYETVKDLTGTDNRFVHAYSDAINNNSYYTLLLNVVRIGDPTDIIMRLGVNPNIYGNSSYPAGTIFNNVYYGLSQNKKQIAIITYYNNTETSTIDSSKINLFGIDLSARVVYSNEDSNFTRGYPVNDKWFLEKERDEDSGVKVGAAAIFINNKTEFSNNSQSNLERRLLCISKIQDNKINNILTVLKNGSLYIGGTVSPKPDALENLSDSIKIEGPQIELNVDGTVKMNFSRFLNMDNTPMDEYIRQTAGSAAGQAVAGHAHNLSGDWIGLSNLDNLNSFSAAKDKINEIINTINGKFLLTSDRTNNY